MHRSHYRIQRSPLTRAGVAPMIEGIGSPNKIMAETAEQFPNKRSNRRAKIAKPLRVRPSEPRDDHFEDLPVSVNASKDGIYFVTRRENYYKGMRVFVTFPFSSAHDPMNCEYVAEVVRVETLPN